MFSLTTKAPSVKWDVYSGLLSALNELCKPSVKKLFLLLPKSFEIFAFTPLGDLIRLPSGSTTVDFAFQVHTQVGMQCMGAKINHLVVPLNTKIKNGDIQSKCGWSPFNGFEFKGTPMATIIAGKIKMKDGTILGEPEGNPLAFS